MVRRIIKDAILGMPFLVAQNRVMDFKQPMIQVDGSQLTCTDQQRRLLLSHIQALREVVIPPQTDDCPMSGEYLKL